MDQMSPAAAVVITPRRNKRKPLDPKKLLPSPQQQQQQPSLLIMDQLQQKRQRLGSTGSEERSPQSQFSPSSPAGRSGSDNVLSRSPSPVVLAPKLRFKQAKMITEESNKKSPFRPWDDEGTKSPPAAAVTAALPITPMTPVYSILPDELRRTLSSLYPGLLRPPPYITAGQPPLPPPPPVQDEPLSLVKHNRSEEIKKEPTELDEDEDEDNNSGSNGSGSRGGGKQRNYKNMTRERRVEANARERQRVHTITAAFDTLQAAIPTEDSGQKLSKLSIIKIATSYIMVLSRMAGHDYSADKSAPSVEECIRQCSQLIEEEAKVRKSGSRAA